MTIKASLTNVVRKDKLSQCPPHWKKNLTTTRWNGKGLVLVSSGFSN